MLIQLAPGLYVLAKDVQRLSATGSHVVVKLCDGYTYTMYPEAGESLEELATYLVAKINQALEKP